MRTVVIGATGHIGSYLVPRLVALGHEVVALSRGERAPYIDHAAWQQVERVAIDRAAGERDGSFIEAVRGAKPEVVIDLIGFTPESVRMMIEALAGRVQHYLFCGTIWVHGPSATVPTTEEAPRHPFGEYGVQKEEIERILLEAARRDGFPATLLHPGHIVGPGWVPVNPAGNLNLDVYGRLAHGEPVTLPNLGMETLHHVHADDVALSFERAMARRSLSIGESFHVVSPAAISLRGYAEAVARWFGHEAILEFLPWPEWKEKHSAADAQATWDHIAHSPNCSIEKGRRLIGYHPRYSSLEAVFESLTWLRQHKQIQ